MGEHINTHKKKINIKIFLQGRGGKILAGKYSSLFEMGKITVPSSWEKNYIDPCEAPVF